MSPLTKQQHSIVGCEFCFILRNLWKYWSVKNTLQGYNFRSPHAPSPQTNLKASRNTRFFLTKAEKM